MFCWGKVIFSRCTMLTSGILTPYAVYIDGTKQTVLSTFTVPNWLCCLHPRYQTDCAHAVCIHCCTRHLSPIQCRYYQGYTHRQSHQCWKKQTHLIPWHPCTCQTTITKLWQAVGISIKDNLLWTPVIPHQNLGSQETVQTFWGP